MTPTTTLTLAAFIEARLDEDEAAARAATPGPWVADRGAVKYATTSLFEGEDGGWGLADSEDAAHVARHDPARVLAQVAAIRAVVELHGSDDGIFCRSCLYDDGYEGPLHVSVPCPTLRALAQAWASHPAFDPAWEVGA